MEYQEEKIENNNEFNDFVNFLKNAFVKKNVKNI